MRSETEDLRQRLDAACAELERKGADDDGWLRSLLRLA